MRLRLLDALQEQRAHRGVKVSAQIAERITDTASVSANCL